MRKLKDSGVEWIGEIPTDWSIGRIKYNFYLKGRIGWQGLKADEFVDNGPFLVTGTDFENGNVNWSKCYHISEERYMEAPEIHVENGDLLVTKDGTVGKVAYINNKPEKVSLNSHLLLIRPNSQLYYNKFLFWVIQSPIFDKYFSLSQNGTIMASLSQEKINNFSFPLPGMETQQCIADYLDRKCSQIDAIIARQQEVIEKLKAYKLSVITEAVTKGLNPDVPMKDSGVEWIGEIPEHWTVSVLRYGLDNIQTGPFGSQLHAEDYIEDGIFVINPANIVEGCIVPDNRCSVTESKAQELSRHILDKGDIVFARRGEMGRCACFSGCSKQYLCGTGCIKIRCNANLMPEFISWFLQTSCVKQYLTLNSVGTTMANLNTTIISGIPVVYPPMSEQERIVKYIKNKIYEIDDALKNKLSIVDKFTEYKKSLIYEVVTGKKEV